VKLLVPLSILQTACLLVLTYKLVAGGKAEVAPSRPEAGGAVVPTVIPDRGRDRGLDEERLRRIIREELDDHGAAIGAPATAPEPPKSPPPRDEAADRQQKELVERQLAYYKSVGVIQDDEMASLQTAIAKLNEADRREMMSKLMRALNAREITGRLF
jgi:hypothetical protein